MSLSQENLHLIYKVYLSPTSSRRPWPGDYKMPCLHASARPSVRSSHFYINLNTSFIKISSPHLQAMFMAIKKCVCKILTSFRKQNGRYSQLFENHKDALNLETLQLASSNLHKRYMARKASLIVILT